MNGSINKNSMSAAKRVISALFIAAGLALIGGTLVVASPPGQPGIFPPNSHPFGHSYAKWSEKWWKWALELPVEGHPFVDSPDFDVRTGQHGKVWYLAGVFGTVERTCTIPKGKSLFVGMLNVETSSLEGVPTEEEQRATSNFFADHIVDLSCTLDGVPVDNLEDFRFESPQFTFTAPTPWIFGPTGGTGTSVADGYYVFLKKMHVGLHVLHFTGAFHFSVAEGDPFDLDISLDTTYNLNVTADGDGDDGDGDDCD